jgi:hypothetical protein
MTVVLFGACDRHNLGDLLFPHVAAALLPGRELVVAGLAERDLRVFGGHRVQALHRLAAQGRLHGAHLLHVGGEILTTTAHQAAVMLLRPQDVDGVLATLAREPGLEPDWRRAMLGTSSAMPYVAARADLAGIDRIVFAGAGGVGLSALAPEDRAEVLRRLADADAASVRDATTRAALRAGGVDAALVPDPVVVVERLFGDRIRARARQRPVADVLGAFARGYVAVQLANSFGDDATLACVADELARLVARTNCGLVLFRAGCAPWHDDLDTLVRLKARLPARRARVFESLDAWDVCALLARARAYAGSSLHGAVVAAAFGVPVAALARAGEATEAQAHAGEPGEAQARAGEPGEAQARAGEPGAVAKVAACLDTWHAAEGTRAWAVDRLAEGVESALGVQAHLLAEAAAERAAAYCTAFERLAAFPE